MFKHLKSERFQRTLLATSLVCLILFSYNNCGKVTFHKQGEAESLLQPQSTPDPNSSQAPTPNPSVNPSPATSPTPTATPITPTPTPGVIQTACNNSPHLQTTIPVSFPKAPNTCEWNIAGNLTPLDNFFRARREQFVEFNLPVQSKICGLQFSFNVQPFRYDDNFILTFNESVLASSYDFTSYLISQNNSLIYDWARIVGSQWMDGGANETNLQIPYCIGMNQNLSQCSWPVTDTPGQISMSFDPSLIQNIMSIDPTRTQHYFNMVTIGDNDGTDCIHDAINFTVTVDYVQ